MDPTFRFLDLPVELALLVLRFATTFDPTTYPSLVLVSRGIKDMTYFGSCISDIPVILNTAVGAQSFRDLVTTNSAVARQVRSLWVTINTFVAPDMRAEHCLLLAIVEACVHITKLACCPDVLKIFASQSLALAECKDLTLIENWDPWEEQIRSPGISQIFNRITHLRVGGRMDFNIPECLFSRLTHLSFQCNSGSLTYLPDIHELRVADSRRFPTLAQVVLTMWSYEDTETFMSQAFKVDNRVFIFRRPSELREIDMWQDPVRRKESLWDRAAAQRDMWLERTGQRA